MEQPGPESVVCDLFREGVYLKQEMTERLIEMAEKGAKFFEDMNETRIKLAFDSFDKSMVYALYEILYLLNTNEQWLQEHKFRVKRMTGKKLIQESEEVIDLYIKDAPSGVSGIDNLSSVFRKDFEEYILNEFGRKAVTEVNGRHLPINGVYSIGSIGTVGHKAVASDLDLEVQYDLEPFLFDVNKWSDETLKRAIMKECQGLVLRYFNKKQIDVESVDQKSKAKAKAFFSQRLSQKYPLLYQVLFQGRQDLIRQIRDDGDVKLRSRLIRETINLMKLNARTALSEEMTKGEELLKKRIRLIQDYVQRKFPEEEVYLFPFSLHEFRKGYFGSTLESKESSGGAYELILNYETLMPGIYFTPNIPSHYLFPSDINNSGDTFDKLIEYLRFGVLNAFSHFAARVTNQGPTPDLSLSYVAEHYTAVYWEAFKASYGNLPKATLNLLRYETLLEKLVNKTIIQLIKAPHKLNEIASSSQNIESVLASRNILTPQGVIQLEQEFPLLSYDPWWLRYKVLKIAYGVPGVVSGVDTSELIEISQIVDLAFALHIRLSDVFTKPGDQRKFELHREKVLLNFLARAFPEKTEQRTRLHATFIGDVETVAAFEKDLRRVFQNCVQRVQKKAAKYYVDEKTSREFEVWHHYYTKNFNPSTNVVQRAILSHLQMPRGRVQIGFKQGSGWFFKSLQRESQVGKRFEASILRLLPSEITLIKDTPFLYGLVYCVINGYYGIYSVGTLKESRTAVEFDRRHVSVGTRHDNELAFVRPDQIERIMQKIIKFNEPIKVGYLDCLSKKREIISVMVFLNLLKYGRISILYRDNFDTLYVDSFDLPVLEKHADNFVNAYEKFFKAMPVHKVLKTFFRERKIDIHKVNFFTWVNANCFHTSHAVTNDLAKENDLSERFRQVIFKVHGQHAA